MQRLESKKHQTMLKAISQFEELITIYAHIIPEYRRDIVKENVIKYKDAYNYYNVLLKELEDCINNYKEFHDLLQRMMFPYVRKMNSQSRKNRS